MIRTGSAISLRLFDHSYRLRASKALITFDLLYESRRRAPRRAFNLQVAGSSSGSSRIDTQKKRQNLRYGRMKVIDGNRRT